MRVDFHVDFHVDHALTTIKTQAILDSILQHVLLRSVKTPRHLRLLEHQVLPYMESSILALGMCLRVYCAPVLCIIIVSLLLFHCLCTGDVTCVLEMLQTHAWLHAFLRTLLLAYPHNPFTLPFPPKYTARCAIHNADVEPTIICLLLRHALPTTAQRALISTALTTIAMVLGYTNTELDADCNAAFMQWHGGCIAWEWFGAKHTLQELLSIQVLVLGEEIGCFQGVFGGWWIV